MDEDEILRAEERERAMVDNSIARITGRLSDAVYDGRPRDCVDCEAPIPEKRLKAVPTARRCTDCQGEYDAA